MKNPFNNVMSSGNRYRAIFDFISHKKNGLTKKEAIEYAIDNLGMSMTGAIAAVGIIMSPTINNAGNVSTRGDLFYFENEKIDGLKIKRYFLKWRKNPIPKNVHPSKALQQIEREKRNAIRLAKKAEKELIKRPCGRPRLKKLRGRPYLFLKPYGHSKSSIERSKKRFEITCNSIIP